LQSASPRAQIRAPQGLARGLQARQFEMNETQAAGAATLDTFP